MLLAAADRVPADVVAARRRLYETLLGYEQLRAGEVGAGLARILRRGAPGWLATRPIARAWRGLTDAVRGQPWELDR